MDLDRLLERAALAHDLAEHARQAEELRARVAAAFGGSPASLACDLLGWGINGTRRALSHLAQQAEDARRDAAAVECAGAIGVTTTNPEGAA